MSTCEEFSIWNEKTVTNLKGHINTNQAILILILNVVLPGVGTIVSAFMLDYEKL